MSSEPSAAPSAELSARRIKIVVTGGSVSLFVTPARTSRATGNYGELLPALLAPAGVIAEVRHTGKWFDLINELRSGYERRVRNHFPDVLVLNYGMGECQTNLVPTWLNRHITSWDVSSHPVARWYRRRIVPPTWKTLRRYQRFGARRIGMHSFRLSPQRYRIEMERVIRMAREETACLVLVIDNDPPGSRFRHWMPGIDKRWALYNEVLAGLITELDDPDVRLIPASAGVLDDIDRYLPDGIHRTAEGHEMTAELLATQIASWLDTSGSVDTATPLAERPLS